MSQDGRRTVATMHRSWRPGWMWIIPLAALLVVLWLGIRALTHGGEDVTITFDDAHGLKSQNTGVMYRGIQVGQVSEIKLSNDGQHVVVKASIDESATKFLKSGTRFWLKGANPSIADLSSLGSVLSGPTIEMVPGQGTKQTHFAGLSHKPVLPSDPGPEQDYEVSFTGAVGEIATGEPVKLDGFTVGEVKSTGFRYDAASGAIETPVTIALYPRPFRIADTDQLRAAIGRLIASGLRARLDRSPPLIGAYAVTLDMVPGAPDVSPSVVDGLPQIPVAPGGGLDTIITKANKVPIDQIARNVLDVTKHLDKVVSSPKLADSIAQLDATLKQIRVTVAATGPQITQLVQTLRGTAARLDQVAQAARSALGGPASQSGLTSTMKEMSDAARSLRELADYLDQHPESLIKGR